MHVINLYDYLHLNKELAFISCVALLMLISVCLSNFPGGLIVTYYLELSIVWDSIICYILIGSKYTGCYNFYRIKLYQ